MSDHPATKSSRPPLKSSRKLAKAERNARLEQAEAEWFAFPDLPGKRLIMTETSKRTYTVIDVESDTVLATYRERRGLSPVFAASIASQGRTFEWRPNRYWFVSRVRHLDLIDAATKTPVLRCVGSHIQGKAETRVTLTGQDPLQFPVRGTREKALMTAVTSSGQRLIEYRLNPSERRSRSDHFGWAEIVLNPNAISLPHVELLIAVSRPFMHSYFEWPVGSGG